MPSASTHLVQDCVNLRWLTPLLSPLVLCQHTLAAYSRACSLSPLASLALCVSSNLYSCPPLSCANLSMAALRTGKEGACFVCSFSVSSFDPHSGC